MDVKYTLEIGVSEETLKTLSAARLSLDDLVKTKLEQALFTLTKGIVRVYRADGPMPAIDRYKICPGCGHPWAHHFDTMRMETYTIEEDGIPRQATRQVLKEQPTPTNCADCPPEKPCQEATK